MGNAVEQTHYWQEFSGTLLERLRKPCKHPTFVMYFFGIIILIGGFGLLEPLVSCFVLGSLKIEELPRTLVGASYTYFVAIAATAAVDLILSFQRRRFLLMFFLLCSAVVYVCALFAAVYGTFLQRPVAALVPAIIGYILALFLWWVGNADNTNLIDTPVEPTAPIGADAQPKGDLAGFNA